MVTEPVEKKRKRQKMTIPRQFYPGLEKERTLWWMIFMSLGLHLTMFTAAIVIPNLHSPHRLSPSYTVELVGPSIGGSPSAKQTVTQPSARPKRRLNSRKRPSPYLRRCSLQRQACTHCEKEAPVKVKVENPRPRN